MPYKYSMSGLDYVELDSGYDLHKTAYGDGVAIENADGLHRSLVFVLAASPYRLTGQDVRFLRASFDISQKDLAAKLGTQHVTIARWEGKPHTPIPVASDRTLRMLAVSHLESPDLYQIIVDNFDEIEGARTASLKMSLKGVADASHKDVVEEKWREYG